jgi:hypothetical protein
MKVVLNKKKFSFCVIGLTIVLGAVAIHSYFFGFIGTLIATTEVN